MNISIDYLFLFFIAYSFIGWICEEIWTTFSQKKITKRGMLFGPICPIYGFGAVGILSLLYPWRNTWLRLFFASVLVTSVLEYITSWLLEKIFHAKWWDYSGQPLNLNGRCCLLNSAAFGVGGLALEHLLHPFMEKLLYSKALSPYISYMAIGLAALLSADILLTLRRLVDFNTTMAKFRSYSEQLKERFAGEDWFKEQSLHEMIESVKAKAKSDTTKFSKKFLETLESYTKRVHIIEFWLKKFPTMSTKEYSAPFEYVKKITMNYWEEQKRLFKEKQAARKNKK